MVFWPGSPRRCELGEAELIGAELHRQTEVAGVFVNATLDEVAATADRCRLTLLQLHGDEGPIYCREAARRTGAKVMKAVRVHDAAQVQALRAFPTDLHLLDAYSPSSPGGTGESFDWELALLHPKQPPVVLAGGLTPDNVGTAIEGVHPFAVDTASGTEAEPGRKDPAKLEAFFRAVEAADVGLGQSAETPAA
jgi:phosphoribosylanthranilate isomerase